MADPAATPDALPTRSGCLSEAEVSQVRGAPAGAVPEDVAHHLAGCTRCQERILFGPVRRTRRPREGPSMPTSTRAFILLAVMLAVLFAFFVTLQRLAGRL
jgi:hypothetical protein